MTKRFSAAAVRSRLLSTGAAACLLLPSWLQAAETAAPQSAAPLAPPFDRYQGWRDGVVGDWRAANERVGEIGGWRSYLRESTPAEPGQDADRDAAHGEH